MDVNFFHALFIFLHLSMECSYGNLSTDDNDANEPQIRGKIWRGAIPKGILPWWCETTIALHPASFAFMASCTDKTPFATNGI